MINKSMILAALVQTILWLKLYKDEPTPLKGTMVFVMAAVLLNRVLVTIDDNQKEKKAVKNRSLILDWIEKIKVGSDLEINEKDLSILMDDKETYDKIKNALKDDCPINLGSVDLKSVSDNIDDPTKKVDLINSFVLVQYSIGSAKNLFYKIYHLRSLSNFLEAKKANFAEDPERVPQWPHNNLPVTGKEKILLVDSKFVKVFNEALSSNKALPINGAGSFFVPATTEESKNNTSVFKVPSI